MQTQENYFQHRRLVIATMHKKEKVIVPLLKNNLGVNCFVPEDFDTDVLGTFTGEVERKDEPVTTLRNKCLLAMEKYNCDLAVASEGSFGQHPTIGFLSADDELVMLLDKKNNLEIIARELSAETNFNAGEIKSEIELENFCKQVLFPSHAIILRKKQNDYSQLFKGINDWNCLKQKYRQLKEEFGTVYAETDMRAMYNPTRMKVIERATQKLVDKVNSLCPQCNTPGFGITQAKPGLPCSWCSSPTRSTLSHIYACAKCNYLSEKKFPNQKLTEEPKYCDVCNP